MADPPALPLAAEFARRCAAAGIDPADPAFTYLRRQRADAYRRAGVAQCLCPHQSVAHLLRTDGSRGACSVYGPGGVRCGCAQFTEATGKEAQP